MFRQFSPAEPKRKHDVTRGPGPKPGRGGVRKRRRAGCPICLNPVTVTGRNAKRCTNKCKNYFHKECLATWGKKCNKCPMCREPIDEEVDDDSTPAPAPAPDTGGAARFPSFFDNDDESRAHWSELGYHWDDNGQWVNDQGRTPAQEDPVEYYLQPEEDFYVDQFREIVDQFSDSVSQNMNYWADNGFYFDEHFDAWLFSHGELEYLLPSQVSAYWEYLDAPLAAHCCVDGCENTARFPLRMQQAYDNGWFCHDEGMYCPAHAQMAIEMEDEEPSR